MPNMIFGMSMYNEKMRSEVKMLIWSMSVGAGLIAYAHANFATKYSFEKMYDRVISIDTKLDKLIMKQYD